MSGATEIYICQLGQALNEGRVEYDEIDTRDEAESDAERRCRTDPSIARLAYYAIADSGDFRCIFAYENPAAGKPAPARTLGGAMDRARSRKVVRRKPSLLRQIRAVFEEDR